MRERNLRAAMLALVLVGWAATAHSTGARGAEATHVVIAEAGESAVLIWNATPVVAQLVNDRVSDAIANDRLEHGALRAVATALKFVPHAKTVTVRILYDKTGAVSPVYGDPTFAGVERYAVLAFAAPRGRANARAWKGIRDADPLPRWIVFRVIGTLPPR